MVPIVVFPPFTPLTLHVTVLAALVTVAVNARERPTRTDALVGVTATVTPFCFAAPELGSIISTVASTASRFDPSTWPSVWRFVSSQRGSLLPERYHAEPLSARMIPYFFIARR